MTQRSAIASDQRRQLAQVGEVADVARAERLDQPEQHAAQHRAGEVADAAQHRGGKRLQAEEEAHLVVRDAVVGADHHARHRAERRADDERQRDHAVDVDAHQSGHRLVLRGRAHRDAELRPVDEREEPRHHRDRSEDDRDLDVGDRRAVRIAGDVIRLHADDLRKRERVAAPDDHREMLQDDRQADRRDERREPRRACAAAGRRRAPACSRRPCRPEPRPACRRPRSTSGGSPVWAGKRGDHREAKPSRRSSRLRRARS